MNEDEALLEWLIEQETIGVTLVQNLPREPDQGRALAERIGLVKRTFFG